MLDLQIQPNVENLKAAREKVQDLLYKVKKKQSLKGKAKEKGLDDLRRKIRDGLNER
jgi:hypothetical protein